MKDSVQNLYLSVRQRPIWLLVGMILVGILISLIRAPLFEESIAPQISAPDALRDLPGQLASSWLRMLAAYIFAVIFAIIIGTLAATNEVRGRFLLPVLDILQSVPILGFFPTAIAWFMTTSSEQRVGIELAAIFLIFTSQSWNLAFGVYDGIKSVPTETKEALKSLGLGPLALFRRLYLPAVFPRLIDNSILSWSNGWYFLMACEIISLGPREYRIPGLGSYLSYSIEHHLWINTAMGILGLILLIVAMDFLIWKPLSALASQFRFESTKNEAGISQTGMKFLTFYRNSKSFWLFRVLLNFIHRLWKIIETRLEAPTEKGFQPAVAWTWTHQLSLALIWGALIAGSLYAMMSLISALIPPYAVSPWTILLAVLTSALRIAIAYFVSIAWIIPLVYWLGQNPKLSRIFKSGAQVMASIPATAFFPLIAVIALEIFGFTEIAVTLLLLTGMQWYLLFNVLGGANSLPNDIREAATALGVRKSLYIKKVFIPSITPALVTGSITAVGGGWNALIISEYFKLDGKVQSVFGIGSILAKATYEKSDARIMSLSLFVMVTFILLFNRFFWQKLYKWSEKKFRLEA